MSWTAQKINNLFNPHRTLWLGALGLNITREGQFWDTGREGGRDEESRSKGAGREEGGRMQEEGREEREGGGREAGGRTKVGVRGLEGRKLGGRRREGM